MPGITRHSQSIGDHRAMLADDARAVVETRHLIVGRRRSRRQRPRRHLKRHQPVPGRHHQTSHRYPNDTGSVLRRHGTAIRNVLDHGIHGLRGNRPPVKGPDGPRTTPFSGIRYPNDTTPAGGNPREGHKREKEKGNKQKGPSGNPHGIRPEGKKDRRNIKNGVPGATPAGKPEKRA